MVKMTTHAPSLVNGGGELFLGKWCYPTGNSATADMLCIAQLRCTLYCMYTYLLVMVI